MSKHTVSLKKTPDGAKVQRIWTTSTDLYIPYYSISDMSLPTKLTKQ